MRKDFITCSNIESRSLKSLKTNNHSFNNVIADFVRNADRKIRQSLFFNQTYSITYLYSLLKREADKYNQFSIENVYTYTLRKTGDNHIGGFDIRFNIDDCDIVVRVNDLHNNLTAKLFLAHRYTQTIHCLNETFIPLLNDIYNTATSVRVAA